MNTPNITRGRMIFKVLVVGNDLPLQTGFLSGASRERISCQLYNSVGLSLGVVKIDYTDNVSVALQLWSIPTADRMEGLSRNFTKGHRSIIFVLRPTEIEQIPEIFNRLSLNPEIPIFVVVVGSVRQAEAESYQLDTFFGKQLPVQAVQNIDEIMGLVAQTLISRNSGESINPIIVVLDEPACPLYEPAPPATLTPPNSIDEINEISAIARDLGLRIVGDNCAVELEEGVAWVCMKTGSIRMEPEICRYCSQSCRKQANICIVGTDIGWSSINLRSRALLTVAKIYSLTARMLPMHVKKQIERSTICKRFELNPVIPIEEIPDRMLHGFRDMESGMSLLEVAKERMKEGRLSKDGYSILKKKLDKLESSRSK